MDIQPKTERFLRLKQVQHLIPWCKAQIYKEIREGRFPAPIKAGKSSFWKETDIFAYMARISGSN